MKVCSGFSWSLKFLEIHGKFMAFKKSTELESSWKFENGHLKYMIDWLWFKKDFKVCFHLNEKKLLQYWICLNIGTIFHHLNLLRVLSFINFFTTKSSWICVKKNFLLNFFVLLRVMILYPHKQSLGRFGEKSSYNLFYICYTFYLTVKKTC